jgi:hypothetical protein
LEAYPGALVKKNNQGQRTPLHVLFTDYISPRLTKAMIDKGPDACFIKDKKGFLPAHIACSRHCSPEKLHMLMAVNPQALYEETNDGDTLLSLASTTATKSHPNKTLIDALEVLLNIQTEGSPSRRFVSLSPIQSGLVSEGSPFCPGIVRSMPLSHKKAPIRNKRARRFTFERESFMETIPTTISLDLTVDEVGVNNNHYQEGAFQSDGLWQDEQSSLTIRRPTKKRKTMHLTSLDDDDDLASNDNHDENDDDDRSDTANLLLNLSTCGPRTTEKAAAEALTQFAQV